MTKDTMTERDRKLLLEIERLRRCEDPSIDSPEAQISMILAGLSGMTARIRAHPQRIDIDSRILLDIEDLGRCDDPTVHSAEQQVSELSAGLDRLGSYIAGLTDRQKIARIIDDRIWDGDGDRLPDSSGIAERRERAYAKTDRILALLRRP